MKRQDRAPGGRLCGLRERPRREGLDSFPCDLGRFYVGFKTGENAQTLVREPDRAKPYFTFLRAGQAPPVRLARAAAFLAATGNGLIRHGRLLSTYERGRLLLLDGETLNADVS